MSAVKWKRVTDFDGEDTLDFDGKDTLTVVYDGKTRSIDDNHPSWSEVLEELEAWGGGYIDSSENVGYHHEDETLGEYLDSLFDIKSAVSNSIKAVSDRIVFDGESLFFDGDKIDNRLSRHLKDMVMSGDNNYGSVALFMENLSANPSQESRRHLWRWLEAQETMTLTEDGMIVGYKGVGDDERSLSVTSGTNTVTVASDSGIEQVTGKVPNPVGATVTIARAEVDPERESYCSFGLHVGTWEYASTFGRRILKVIVNPRDVVAVPSDRNGQKMRTCRYFVQEIVAARTTETTVARPAYPVYADNSVFASSPDSAYEDDDWFEGDPDDGYKF